MAEQWLVRIGEKEYGPADFETLAQWEQEGRLLPENEVRSLSDPIWSTANAIPGLFAPPPLPARTRLPLARRNFAEFITESVHIYRRAFLPLFVAACAVGLPMLILELTSPAYGIFPKSDVPGLTGANLVALLAFTILVVLWPIFLATVQLATFDVRQDRRVSMGDLLRRAVALFPRMALLSALVYGSYLFWTALPVLAILGLVSANPSLASIFFAFLLLAVQILMVSRLWVNFLFWQQSAVLAGHDGMVAIRESKMLARSKRRARAIERPLWRGALLASLWFLVTLGISAGAELPFVLSKLQNVTTPEQMLAVVQTLNSPQTASPALIVSACLATLLHALVRPVFGIAFVLLYFDARSDFSEEELDAFGS